MLDFKYIVFSSFELDITLNLLNSGACKLPVLSVIFAVKTGQDVFSLFGHLAGSKITFNTKERIIKLAQIFVENGNMRAYKGRDEECVDKFLDIVTNNFDYYKNKSKGLNSIKSLFLRIE